MSKTKGPSITLADPVTKKTAALNDPQAVRLLLHALLERLGNRPDDFETEDPTEIVGLEILKKCRGLRTALKLVEEAESLADIFAGTSLEEDANDLSKKGDRPTNQIPLPRGKDLEVTQSDAATAIEEVWSIFCRQIEASEGNTSQTIDVKITWNPPTENRDGYIGTLATLKVQGKKITRTGQVSKKRGGGHQFNLFAESAGE